MSGVFHEGRWYEGTGMACSICGNPVYESDLLPEYSYQCFHCDMDMYLFEAFERDSEYLQPVMVARPVGGITLNGGAGISAGWRWEAPDICLPAGGGRLPAGSWAYGGRPGSGLFCGGEW